MSPQICAILLAGAAVGSIDAIANTTLAYTNGVSPVRAWQFVASGLLGPKAFVEGTKSMLLGRLLHFFISFSVATAFILAASVVPGLLVYPLMSGSSFGLIVYFVMKLVISLSATPKREVSRNQILGQLIIHIFIIGVPIAFIAKHFLA